MSFSEEFWPTERFYFILPQGMYSHISIRTLILLAQFSFSSSQAPFSLHLLLAISLLDHFVCVRSIEVADNPVNWTFRQLLGSISLFVLSFGPVI